MSKIVFLLFPCLVWAAPRQDSQVKFSRTCRVLRVADVQSPPACEIQAGTFVDKYRVSGPTFVEVNVGLCRGYVQRNCLVVVRQAAPSVPGAEKKVTVSPVYYSGPPAKTKSIVLFGSLDGLLGSTTGASSSAKGKGFGIGLGGKFNLNKKFRLMVGPSYQTSSIGRSSEASANTVTYDHSYKHIGGLLLGQLSLDPSAAERGSGFAYWINGGLQYLHPLSATQTTSFSGDTTFEAPKLLLAMAGISGEIPFGDTDMGFSVSLNFFYNVLSPSTSKLLGGRLLLAFSHGI